MEQINDLNELYILLETAPDSMIVTGSDGKILMVNQQTEQLFGFKRNEIIGTEIEVLIPQKYHQLHKTNRAVYMAHPKTRPMGAELELYGVRKNGNEFPVEISLSPLKSKNTGETLVMASIRDISRQKEAENQIKKLNENLEHLVSERTRELEQSITRLEFLEDASEILTSTLDYCETLRNLSQTLIPRIADMCIIYEYHSDGTLQLQSVSHHSPEKNNLAIELTQQYPPDPSLPDFVYEVIRSRAPKLFSKVTDETLSDIARDQDHLRLLHEIGPQSAIIVPMFIRDKVFGVLILILTRPGASYYNKDIEFGREIARRAMLAIENARLYEESLRTNQILEEKVAKRTHELETINIELEAFSYSVSHDLRAPIRRIEGFSDLILNNHLQNLDNEAQDYFQRIRKASRQMGSLIDDLLKLSRLSRVEMNLEMSNLSEMAANIISELQITDPARKAEIVIQPGMFITVDKNLMQIALGNLIENAWKYSKNQQLTKIEFASYKKDKLTTFFIRDNGVGFDMKYANRLFKSFQRLHSSTDFEGTGIGLALVQRIMNRHHGKIWVESETNKGTTVFFNIPATKLNMK